MAQKIALLSVMALALVFTAQPAAAHSDLVGSDPADGSIVTESINNIDFHFSAPVEPFFDGFGIFDVDGEPLEIAEIRQPDPTTVSVSPSEPITESISAHWAIVSGDTHPVTGYVVILVDIPPDPTPQPTPNSTETNPTADPTPQPTEAESTSTPSPEPTSVTPPESGDPPAAEPNENQEPGQQRDAEPTIQEQRQALIDQSAQVADRANVELLVGTVKAVSYLTTVVAAGALIVAALLRRQHGPMWSAIRPFVLVGGILLALSACALIGAQLANLTGEVGDFWAIDRWKDVFTGRTRVGTLMRGIGALLLVATALRKTGPRLGCVAVATLTVLASYPMLGHQADGISSLVAAPSSMIHVAAISIWIGGLLAVVATLLKEKQLSPRALVRSFSRIAGFALAATVAAGVALTIAQLGALSDLWQTSYGKRLLIKIGLVAAVVALGANHRYRTVPNMTAATGDSATKSFVRLSALELSLAGGVLATTAWLVASG